MEFVSKLQQARVARRWTTEYVAEQVGVQTSTVSRWENGHEYPRPSYVAALEKLYGMPAKDLGLEEALLPRQQKPWKLSGAVRDAVKGNLLLRLQVLIVTAGVTYQELARLQSCIVQELERPDTMNDGMSRREAVRLLATLPIITFKLSISEASALALVPTEEILKHCAAGIVACEQLAKGDAGDLALANSALSHYLPTLKEIVTLPVRYHKSAASLTAQALMGKALLAAHLKGSKGTERYAQDAVSYSQESGDVTLQIAALSRLAWVYFREKQYKQATQTILKADYLIAEQMKTGARLPALVRTSIHSEVAKYLTCGGRVNEGKVALQQAYESFSDRRADDSPIYLDFSEDLLLLEDGTMHYHGGEPEEALSALGKVIDLSNADFALKLPISSKRTYVEIINYAALASMKLSNQQKDKERSIALCDAGLDGAIALQSEPRLSESLCALDMMECAWPDDSRVRDLREKAIRGWGKPNEDSAIV